MGKKAKGKAEILPKELVFLNKSVLNATMQIKEVHTNKVLTCGDWLDVRLDQRQDIPTLKQIKAKVLPGTKTH